MISSRGYTDNDLPQLQTALAAWIQEAGDCGYCHVGELSHYIYSRLHGKPQHELVQIWQDEADVIGIGISHIWDNAFAVYTKPNYRGTEDELTMLEATADATLKSMKQRGSSESSVIIDVWDKDETRQAQLKKLGFEYFRMWAHLTEQRLSKTFPEPKLLDDFTIRSCTLDDAERYITAYNSAFNGKWNYEDYHKNVMEKPGYHPENVKVVVAPDGQFAAFTILWFDEVNKVALFEPVGTHQDFHRQGLARNLILHCLHEMQQRSMKIAGVGHYFENMPALNLYRNLGFEKKYEIQGYERT